MSKAETPSVVELEQARHPSDPYANLPIPPAAPLPPRAHIPASDPDTGPRLEKFMTLAEVIAATGQAKPTIYRKMSQGVFPQQIRLEVKPGAYRSIAVWIEREVIQWQQEQIAKRDAGCPDQDREAAAPLPGTPVSVRARQRSAKGEAHYASASDKAAPIV
jgi:predicted DNA-binding transcriptional regulator AlpA